MKEFYRTAKNLRRKSSTNTTLAHKNNQERITPLKPLTHDKCLFCVIITIKFSNSINFAYHHDLLFLQL